MDEPQIEHFESLLRMTDIRINQFIEENSFHLNFCRKEWASNPQGQQLLEMTRVAIEISVLIVRYGKG